VISQPRQLICLTGCADRAENAQPGNRGVNRLRQNDPDADLAGKIFRMAARPLLIFATVRLRRDMAIRRVGS